MSNLRGRGSNARGGRGGAWHGQSSALKGTFLNGVWHCDCTPPLPAVHFQTKKAGPNNGKWFRTCQKPQEQRCKFFLWDTEAHPREAAALASNSRSEPDHGTTTTPRAQRAVSPPPTYAPDAGPSRSGRKRDRATAQEEQDEFDLGEGNADIRDELDQVMAAAETPSKRPRTDAFATPSRPARRRLPWQTDPEPLPSALPTPQTESRTSNELFPTRFTAPGGSLLTPSRYHSSEEFGTVTPSSSPNETPTPARFKNASEHDLVRDAFDVLREANVELSEQTRRNLAAILSRHATIAEGVKKGRNVARASITAKTAKVTELTYRVSTLEAELEAEKAKVSHLQWTVEHGQQSD
ncbi:uncharacterized protein CC84DRAFT_419324 [Paraphaeosphaeria sporulosa]|uniref:GRF-type domain-containing protein n=1 Tax=Paraphaeosphaeria sporulosa TaxID=1460663 RepID=A0A177BVG2_9PLEO|nr:uncharacterized protein CC84DRAFT_419324 [Paraphaeosphaeria sporulosa]OAF99145.1 hypothetical protein CC84DRAFT_419324 [Paraphaeosphaeria sporulosa]